MTFLHTLLKRLLQRHDIRVRLWEYHNGKMVDMGYM